MDFYCLGHQHGKKPCFFSELGHMVSLVGGGGKSTLMYALAHTLARQGKRVLVTTTTHIWMPSDCFAPTVSAAHALWEMGKFAVIGSLCTQHGKLTQPMDALFQQLSREADLVLVEADGAKHCPIKAPRNQEPVIVSQTDMVIAVMGLSAIGQPLQCCCFGLQEAMALLQTDQEHVLTEEDAALLLASSAGGRKHVEDRRFVVILNQCDDEGRRHSGKKIAAALNRLGVHDIWATGFTLSERCEYNKLAHAGNKEAKK